MSITSHQLYKKYLGIIIVILISAGVYDIIKYKYNNICACVKKMIFEEGGLSVKKTAFIVFVILILSVFVFSAVAVEADSVVLRNVSRFVLENNTEKELNSFNETNEGWDIVSSELDISLAEKIDTFPHYPLTGNGCLIVRNRNAKSNSLNSVAKQYKTPIDLSSYNGIGFVLNCAAVKDSDYFVAVRLYSTKDIYETHGIIGGKGWDCLFVDISDWENRDKIKKIEISVGYSNENIPTAEFEYYIDSIRLFENENVLNLIKYSAESYVVSGGEAEFNHDNIKINTSSDVLRLDSRGFAYESLGDANCMRIKYSSKGRVSDVALYVQRTGRGLAEESKEVPVSYDGSGEVCLPINDGKIDEISLVFNGSDLDEVIIHSITPYSTYVGTDNAYGNIDTCAINSNTMEIIVKGRLSGTIFQTYQNGDLYLFSNDLSDNITPEMLKNCTFDAKSSIVSDEFIFRLGYAGASDKREFLYKKYTVAVKDEDDYIIIGGSCCITNPESFLKEAPKKNKTGSGKGIYGESISFMQEMGVSDTAVWLDIGKFFSLESNNGSKFECGGALYYYNSKYAESISSLIDKYKQKGIDVTLILVIGDTGNEALNRLLIHGGSTGSADYYAYNTSSSTGLMYLRAVCEYWASKYSDDLVISRVVFGDSVGDAHRSYNMGDATLDKFTEEYAKGLRTVYNAFKSYAPYIDIYTYIDDNWDKDLPFDLYARYDNKAFISSLSRCIADSGDIGWGIAQNPYPYLYEDYFSYRDLSIEREIVADRISFKNIDVVAKWLKSGQRQYIGGSDDYIVIEKTEFNKLDEKTVTADYVYNCYKAMSTDVSAYITNRNCNYDDAMKYIDTTFSLSSTRFASEVLGIATWGGVIDGFSESNIVKRKINRVELAVSDPGVKGSVVLSDFSKDKQGWEEYGYTERVVTDAILGDAKGLLSLDLGAIPKGESRGIVKRFETPYDMSIAPIIHFRINAAKLPMNIDQVNISVVIVSGNDVLQASGSINVGEWVDVYCNFGGFAAVEAVDEIRILFHASENYYEDSQIFISSVENVSTEHDSEALLDMFNPESAHEKKLENIRRYAYTVLGVVILVCVLLFVWRRTAAQKEK